MTSTTSSGGKSMILAGDGAMQFAVENGFEFMPRKLSADAEKTLERVAKEIGIQACDQY